MNIIELPNDIYTNFGLHIDGAELCSLFLTCKTFETQRRPLTMRDKCQAERLFLNYPRDKNEVIAYSKLVPECWPMAPYPICVTIKYLFTHFIKKEVDGLKTFIKHRPDEEIEYLLISDFFDYKDTHYRMAIRTINTSIFNSDVKISLRVFRCLMEQKYLLLQSIPYFNDEQKDLVKVSNDWLLSTPFDKDLFNEVLKPFYGWDSEIFITDVPGVCAKKLEYFYRRKYEVNLDQLETWTNQELIQWLILRRKLTGDNAVKICIRLGQDCFLWLKNTCPGMVRSYTSDLVHGNSSRDLCFEQLDELVKLGELAYKSFTLRPHMNPDCLNKNLLKWTCKTWPDKIDYYEWFRSINSRIFLEIVFEELKFSITIKMVKAYERTLYMGNCDELDYIRDLIKKSEFKDMIQ